MSISSFVSFLLTYVFISVGIILNIKGPNLFITILIYVIVIPVASFVLPKLLIWFSTQHRVHDDMLTNNVNTVTNAIISKKEIAKRILKD